jgi:hypothetical protein
MLFRQIKINILLNDLYNINFQSNDKFCKIHIYYYYRQKMVVFIIIFFIFFTYNDKKTVMKQRRFINQKE